MLGAGLDHDGLITVVNTYVSQNLGAGKSDRAPAYAWNGLWMSVMYWLVVMIPFGLVLPSVFEAIRASDLTPEQLAEVIRRDALATGYGRILIYGSLVTMASRAIAQFFYGMHKPVVVLVASLVGNVLNLVLNSLLIYGPTAPRSTGIDWLDAWFSFTASLCEGWGWSAHGINGAGYATVIATVVELIIPMAVFVSPRYVRKFGTLAQWRPSLPHIRDLFKIGWPGADVRQRDGLLGVLHGVPGWRLRADALNGRVDRAPVDDAQLHAHRRSVHRRHGHGGQVHRHGADRSWQRAGPGLG